MIRTFTIRSANSGDRLEFVVSGHTLESFLIRVVCNGLAAEAAIWDGGYSTPHLHDLLQSLAADWKGWEGIRTWENLEGTLALQFSFERMGHVIVDIRLDGGSDAWKIEAQLILEVGTLDGLAREAERFFLQASM